jgi:hypothetical protein
VLCEVCVSQTDVALCRLSQQGVRARGPWYVFSIGFLETWRIWELWTQSCELSYSNDNSFQEALNSLKSEDQYNNNVINVNVQSIQYVWIYFLEGELPSILLWEDVQFVALQHASSL